MQAIPSKLPDDGMASPRTTTLTLRIDPLLKNALRVAAQREQRSMSNMIETLIQEHCISHGSATPAPKDRREHGAGSAEPTVTSRSAGPGAATDPGRPDR